MIEYAAMPPAATGIQQFVQPLNPHLGQPAGQEEDEPSPGMALCEVCAQQANFLCSGCQLVYYCTTDCQVRCAPIGFTSNSFHLPARELEGSLRALSGFHGK